MRRLHKAFLRYHDPDNWPLLREALKRMGRADLIGNGKHHLIPAYQPLAAKGRAARPRLRPCLSARSTRGCPNPAREARPHAGKHRTLRIGRVERDFFAC